MTTPQGQPSGAAHLGGVADATLGPPADPAPTPPAPAAHVGNRAARGAVAVAAQSGVVNLLQLVSSLLVARSLFPEQYGAFALASTLVGLGRFLGDGGAGSALIQAPGRGDPRDEDLGRVLAIQLLVATVATTLFVGGAPLLTAGFDAPAATTWLTIVLAASLLIEVPAVVGTVRLRRQMRYERLAVIQLASFAALYAVQIPGLLAGWNVWALVVGQLAGSAALTLATLLLGGRLVRPVRRGSTDLVRRGLAFQGTQLAQASIAVASVAVVGLSLSAADLGLWTWSTVLATPLVLLAHNLQLVALPSLSRLHEHAPARLRGAVATVARLQFLLIAVAVASLAGFAAPLIAYVFDPAWLGATGAARFALLGVFPLMLSRLLGAAVDSTGRPRVRLVAMLASGACGLVSAVPLAAAYGPTGAAVGVYVVTPALDCAFLLAVHRVDIRRALLNGLLVGVPTYALALGLAERVDRVVALLPMGVLAGLCSLALVGLVDRHSVRVAWSLVRGRHAVGG